MVSTDKDCQGIFEETLLLSDKASAYPNPIMNAGSVSIDLGLEMDLPLTVQVYDLNGKMLYSEQREAIYGKMDVDLSSYSNGMYLVKVRGKDVSHEFKIIKQ